MTSDRIPVSADLAAHAAGVNVATLRQWARRGHISPPIDGQYDLAEITAYIELRDASGQFGRALSGRRRRGETRASLH